MSHQDTRQQILRLFRDNLGGFVSGEQISQVLGVSRTAVWKQVKLLRGLGYRIEAITSRGYRLIAGPDALLADEIRSRLDGQLVGAEIVQYAETDSTNLRAMELGEHGAAEGLVVIADLQTAGKGRLGRSWSSPAGVNLYTSVLLRPPIQPWDAPQLTFLSAVATARAIHEVTGLSPRVKWPNDLLLGGKKVAGLLNEMSAETEAVHCVVLGIGININMSADQFPADLRYPATSLAIEKQAPVSRLELATALYRHLEGLYQEFLRSGIGSVLAAWQELCDLVGRQVRVASGPVELTGEVTGLGADGALLLRCADGSVERILAGDVLPL